MYHLHSPKGWDHRSRVMSYSVEVLRKDAIFVPEVRSPTVRRRELGALLRALRTENGLTVEQVAERLLCSSSKVSRMETGHGIATPRDIRDLCDLYGVTDETDRERMMNELLPMLPRCKWASATGSSPFSALSTALQAGGNADIVIAPTHHHALVVSPFYAWPSTVPLNVPTTDAAKTSPAGMARSWPAASRRPRSRC